MYMSESTNPAHSLSFLLASLRSELTFLWTGGKVEERRNTSADQKKEVKSERKSPQKGSRHTMSELEWDSC